MSLLLPTVTATALLTAPVPASRNQRGRNLVSAKRPGSHPLRGHVQLAWLDDPSSQYNRLASEISPERFGQMPQPSWTARPEWVPGRNGCLAADHRLLRSWTDARISQPAHYQPPRASAGPGRGTH